MAMVKHFNSSQNNSKIFNQKVYTSLVNKSLSYNFYSGRLRGREKLLLFKVQNHRYISFFISSKSFPLLLLLLSWVKIIKRAKASAKCFWHKHLLRKLSDWFAGRWSLGVCDMSRRCQLLPQRGERRDLRPERDTLKSVNSFFLSLPGSSTKTCGRSTTQIWETLKV